MTTFWLTVYVLIWPVVVAGVLLQISRAFFRDWRQARRDGRSII